MGGEERGGTRQVGGLGLAWVIDCGLYMGAGGLVGGWVAGWGGEVRKSSQAGRGGGMGLGDWVAMRVGVASERRWWCCWWW